MVEARPQLFTKGVPAKLWQAYYDRFCALALVSSVEELRQLQLNHQSFKDKAAWLNLQVMSDSMRPKLGSAISTIILQANTVALA